MPPVQTKQAGDLLLNLAHFKYYVDLHKHFALAWDHDKMSTNTTEGEYLEVMNTVKAMSDLKESSTYDMVTDSLKRTRYGDDEEKINKALSITWKLVHDEWSTVLHIQDMDMEIS